MTVLEWKRGDSFVVNEPGMLIEDPAGTLTMVVDGKTVPASRLNITGWTIKSQIRRKDNGVKVVDCVVTLVDASHGSYKLEVKDTTAWPVTTLAWDIEFTDANGYVASTPTMYIRCKVDQTRAA